VLLVVLLLLHLISFETLSEKDSGSILADLNRSSSFSDVRSPEAPSEAPNPLMHCLRYRK